MRGSKTNRVGVPGIEPGTSFLSGKRSTTEPHTQGKLQFSLTTLSYFVLGNNLK
jgi:hypothetical protein